MIIKVTSVIAFISVRVAIWPQSSAIVLSISLSLQSTGATHTTRYDPHVDSIIVACDALPLSHIDASAQEIASPSSITWANFGVFCISIMRPILRCRDDGSSLSIVKKLTH